ncbi:MAG: 3-oxoacyl-[acyl-carrier-protein] reductase, partial [Pseudomonadota bacterium]
GGAIAKRLADDGFDIVATATGQRGLAAINSALTETGRLKAALALDLLAPDAISKFSDELGELNLSPSVVVNNAAVTRDNLFLRMKEAEWQEVIDVNLTGIFQLCKLVVRPMIKSRWGRVVNITSVVGISGNAGQSNYAAAKAGLIGFTKSLAQEVASRGITANTVAPGFIETDMTDALSDDQRKAILAQVPAGRMGAAAEVAAAVAYLCSEQASYITGETLHVNGGMYMA